MTINKYIAALVLCLGLSTPSFAADCPTGSVSQETITAQVKEAGATVSVLSDSLQKTLEDKIGRPPHSVDGEVYSIIRVDMNNFSALQVIVNGCTTLDHIGPVPSELIDNKLGLVNG